MQTADTPAVCFGTAPNRRRYVQNESPDDFNPLGQTLIVTAGCGWAQREGGPIEEIHFGDVVWFPQGEKHWHGATPTIAMTHIAIQEAPGWVRTRMGGEGASLSPEEGADTAIWLATLPKNGQNGGFFRERKKIEW